MRNTNRDYINGPTFYRAICDWYAKGGELPITLYHAVEQICERLATRYNYRNYTYIDEMIDSAKLKCTIALLEKKYDISYDNPFGYFSRIANNEFISIIKVEKKESAIKHKSLEDHRLQSILSGQEIETATDDGSGRIETLLASVEGKNKKEKEKGKDDVKGTHGTRGRPRSREKAEPVQQNVE